MKETTPSETASYHRSETPSIGKEKLSDRRATTAVGETEGDLGDSPTVSLLLSSEDLTVAGTVSAEAVRGTPDNTEAEKEVAAPDLRGRGTMGTSTAEIESGDDYDYGATVEPANVGPIPKVKTTKKGKSQMKKLPVLERVTPIEVVDSESEEEVSSAVKRQKTEAKSAIRSLGDPATRADLMGKSW